MTYADAGGVHTWYDEHGACDPLVLLHGGFADASEFGANIPALAARFRVLTPERRGHGHTADVAGPITYQLMADDTAAFLDTLGIGRAHLVGHSDGAKLAVIPGTSHALIIEKPGLCNEVILDFLTREPVPTYMPIRRLPSRPPSG